MRIGVIYRAIGVCGLTLTLAFVMARAGAALANDLVGRASVIDGDTLEIHGQRIRLWGIDAPEHDQVCRGEDSLPYRCGVKAANDLNDFIAQRPVMCLPRDTDRYGRTVAICLVAGIDLSEWLVGHGLALDWSRYSHGYYASSQHEAHVADRGMWSGSFIEPWLFRNCVRRGSKPADCSDELR
jgi:endonuclease YncB( thermonuclease family)